MRQEGALCVPDSGPRMQTAHVRLGRSDWGPSLRMGGRVCAPGG